MNILFGWLGSVALAVGLVAQDKPVTPKFVRVQPGGTKLFNLADKNAEVVLRAPAATLLQVHSERAGYLDVSTPGGVEVWVYGEYAKPAAQAGMLEITGNGVSMRPLPQSDEKSFPLAQRLMKGDQVRYLGRNDDKKPLQEDWLKVVSPSSAHAWVLATETTPLAAGEDGAALWTAAESAARAAAVPVAVPVLAGAAAKPTAASGTPPVAEKPKGAAQPAAAQTDALAQAEKLMETARKSSAAPDFVAAKTAYKHIVETSPSGAAADTARVRLQEIDAREELVALRAQGKQNESTREQELAKKNEELREASLYQDPLWGRFQARGWLEKVGDRYVIRWANKLTSELSCTRKRYDLEKYVGFEIGVTGVAQRASAGGAGAGSASGVIDVQRIEVLSGAGAPR